MQKANIIGYVLCFILGCILTGTVIYTTAIKYSDNKLRAAQATITELTDTNKQLQTDYNLARATAGELAERLGNRQEVINRIAETVGSLSAGLDQSSDIIQQAIDTISRIEYILYH